MSAKPDTGVPRPELRRAVSAEWAAASAANPSLTFSSVLDAVCKRSGTGHYSLQTSTTTTTTTPPPDTLFTTSALPSNALWSQQALHPVQLPLPPLPPAEIKEKVSKCEEVKEVKGEVEGEVVEVGVEVEVDPRNDPEGYAEKVRVVLEKGGWDVERLQDSACLMSSAELVKVYAGLSMVWGEGSRLFEAARVLQAEAAKMSMGLVILVIDLHTFLTTAATLLKGVRHRVEGGGS